MKRDVGCMRELLLELEASDKTYAAIVLDFQDPRLASDDTTDGEPLNHRAYNLWLLVDDRYVDGEIGSHVVAGHRLTMAGCDFLDSIRDDGVLDQTKRAIGVNWSTASVDLVKQVANHFINKGIEGVLGARYSDAGPATRPAR